MRFASDVVHGTLCTLEAPLVVDVSSLVADDAGWVLQADLCLVGECTTELRRAVMARNLARTASSVIALHIAWQRTDCRIVALEQASGIAQTMLRECLCRSQAIAGPLLARAWELALPPLDPS